MGVGAKRHKEEPCEPRKQDIESKEHERCLDSCCSGNANTTKDNNAGGLPNTQVHEADRQKCLEGEHGGNGKKSSRRDGTGSPQQTEHLQAEDCVEQGCCPCIGEPGAARHI